MDTVLEKLKASTYMRYKMCYVMPTVLTNPEERIVTARGNIKKHIVRVGYE